MDNNGLPLFSVSYMCNHGGRCHDISNTVLKNPTLFSAFLGGIFGLSEEIGGNLQHISITNMEIFAYSTHGTTAVWITDPLGGPDLIDDNKNRVRLIAELFQHTYAYYIENKKIYDTNLFIGFQKILEYNGLVDDSLKFKKNCLNCIYDKACPFRIISGDPNSTLEEKISQIPNKRSIGKLLTMVKSVKKYKPITEERQHFVASNTLRSLSIIDKKTNKAVSFGYGCNKIPFRRLSNFEGEFIKGEVLSLLKDEDINDYYQVKYSPVNDNIAYGVVHKENLGVLAEYYYDQGDVDILLNDVLSELSVLLPETISDTGDLIDLQMIEENQPISFCDDCLVDNEQDCFTKNVLLEMDRSLFDLTKKNLTIEIQRSHKLAEELNETQSIAKMGSWEWDMITDIISWSDGIYEIFDFDRSIQASVENFIKIIHPDDLDDVNIAISDAIEVKGEYNNVHRLNLPNGDLRYVYVCGQIVYSANDNKPIKMKGTAQDVTKTKLIEMELENRLNEKEVLIQEIHHRVRNNLQVILSLLDLEIGQNSKSEFVNKTKSRIKSMLLVHEELFGEESVGRINAQTLINDIVKMLEKAYSEVLANIQILQNIEDCNLTLNNAISVSLIVNEAITNSIKHAFKENKGGEIMVKLRDDGRTCDLQIKDNGSGFNRNLTKKSMGIQMMEALAIQLGSSLIIDTDEGTTVQVKFYIGVDGV